MNPSAEHLDCLVIGAGVVGLAIARALAQQGRDVVVVEAQSAIGTQTSARNSEVIHAGIYYPEGSLKARLCVRGRQLLYAYCAERTIAHRRCGKLIVATDEDQLKALVQLQLRAQANGVSDLVWLDGTQAHTLEPALRCVAALHSPSTGIVDSQSFMRALHADLEDAGGVVVFNTRVERRDDQGERGAQWVLQDGTRVVAMSVVNAAGLQAPDLACQIEGLDSAHIPTPHFAKGNYFALTGRAPFSRLIYPAPEAAGLGVHLTLDLGGQARFGPDVEWVDDPEDLQVRPQRGDVFYAEVRKYWPELPHGALVPAFAGMRPKISGPGEAAADFCIQGPQDHGVPGLVNLFGIESPGLTSALAIGEMVARLAANG
ncbi:NAD(P)/FAD-dependent oxidoreductase [Rhodoferax sp. GW822-FHT02A01]|uniref:NAD(P)/FAD-dependent oxidoreductase n=1 Tax=Rhodoferax sp. GW822-FHT02A01 TaxID=3141537 RepID=UPI00315C7210